MEEEGRLYDMLLRENFIESVFVYKRWRTTRANKTPGSLITFHTDHKMLLRAHSETHYRELGRVVARLGKNDPAKIFSEYQELLMTAMKLKPTVKKHVNVLMHMMGYFKKVLSSDEKREVLEVIEQFRNNYVPLIVPITLFNHYTRKYDQPYLMSQYYLKPHPTELKLRNHA